MLDLFICHLNPSAMRRLAQKLEEENGDSELRRYCERILRVRSTGWTQGIFANFAAESMVPKGPEWGGGNWEIKTPTNLKAIPQWELAAEVMPYMRTDDGAIPSIISDHIGVYLGAIKGRGNVVAVREDTLVKVLKPTIGDAALPSGSQPSVSALNTSNGLPITSKPQPLMGLEALMKSTTSAADEQAKAEEEFKRTMYGAADDGSSSDEEGVSKTKKLQIRIRDKPISSTTVDVNKIKEATQQFKLGVPPLSRTKSLDPVQGPVGAAMGGASAPGAGAFPSPAIFAPNSVPGNLFGTDAFTQPAPGAQQGTMGVTAAPIPEDFFQNTIPSLQVAAALPPAGTYLSRMEQVAQGGENGKVTNNQVSGLTPNIGFPDGGVPPQAAPTAVPYEPIGLADGGVPPQSAPQTVQTMQAPAQVVPISTQPLDLSVLGVPPESAKPRPASPPSAVRPGQVNIHYLCFYTYVS